MKIVVTHQNADFDALASAVAACRVFDCDFIAATTSYESSVHVYIKNEEPDLPIRRMKLKELDDIERIELLVITDCKRKNRLGTLAPLVEKAESIIIFDHHPAYQQDIDADEIVLEEIGSTTTLLVERGWRDGVEFTRDELSLMLLGIYEDTGLLTFSSTTPRDIEAAAALLSAGADLSLVNEYVKRDLSREQVFALNELFMNLVVHNRNGISIGVSHSSLDKYVDEVSYLAHRIIDSENLDSLFILVRTGPRLVLVGRSKVNEVDASAVVNMFGGGGHPVAASAIVKDMTLPEALEKLQSIVSQQVNAVRTVAEVMTAPVKFVEADATFNKAMDMFMRSNLNMMPVVAGGRTVGLISRRDILHGIKHGFTKEPIDTIMQIEFETITPDAPYYAAEELMLGKNQKLLPVEVDNQLVGVITRTDMLRTMHEKFSQLPREQKSWRVKMGLEKTRNIAGLVYDRLPQKYVDMLKEIGAIAEEMGFRTYVVGGFVRDLMMRNENFDIDIVVEGDAPKLAKKYARKHGAKVSEHKKFRTAVVIFPDDFRVDFATSRTEYYARPSAAPEVEDASIRNDLYRRDFTINAMALNITGGNFGQLIDFYGGQKDIQDRKIRVLHSLSFVDDPSRGFRMVRFAVRFGFEVGPHTEKLLRHAESLNLFDRIIGRRMFLELKYIMSEDHYRQACELMMRYDLLRFFHHRLKVDQHKREQFDMLERIYAWYGFQFSGQVEIWKSRFCVLFGGFTFAEFVELADRLELPTKEREELFLGYMGGKNAAVRLRRHRNVRASQVVKMFENLPVEFVLYASVLLGQGFLEHMKAYFTHWRTVKPSITGNDLKKAGFRPSKLFAKTMQDVKNALLDGKIKKKEDELAFAVKKLEEYTRGE